MARWGRGWEVSARKAIWEQEQARRQAAVILAREHGEQHVAGSRRDLCPTCQAMPEAQARGEGGT